jgi:hypothetical protein
MEAPRVPYSDPQLTRLLSNNDEPLPHEVHQIRQTLSRRRARLAELEKEIETLTKQLQPLQAQKLREEEEIYLRAGVVSPLRRFRNDLIALILEFATSDPWKLRLLSGTNDSWSYARVCTQWRTVILSLPCAWNGITIEGEVYLYQPAARSLRIFNEVLSRSQNLPLYVTITARFMDWNLEGVAVMTALVCKLFTHSERFREMRIELPFAKDNYLVEVCSILYNRIPALSSINLYDTEHCCNANDITRILGCFEVAPNLKELSMATQVEFDPDDSYSDDNEDGDSNDADEDDDEGEGEDEDDAGASTVPDIGTWLLGARFPWEQIQKFNFWGLSLPDQLQVLRKLKSLVMVHLPGSDPKDKGIESLANDPNSESLIRLPHAHSLYTSSTPAISILDLPVLERISCSDDVPVQHLQSLISRSPCLRGLRLSIDNEGEDLGLKVLELECLQTSLTSLQVSIFLRTLTNNEPVDVQLRSIRKIVNALTVPHSAHDPASASSSVVKVFLPKLEQLIVALPWSRIEPDDFDIIICMVKSRYLLPPAEETTDANTSDTAVSLAPSRLRKFELLDNGYYGYGCVKPELHTVNAAAARAFDELRKAGLWVTCYEGKERWELGK